MFSLIISSWIAFLMAILIFSLIAFSKLINKK